MHRFSSELRVRFPHRAHVFDDYEQEVGEWEDAFREYAKVATGEQSLLRRTKRLTARRQVVIQATSLASRGVNLANAVVLLLNRQPRTRPRPSPARCSRRARWRSTPTVASCRCS